MKHPKFPPGDKGSIEEFIEKAGRVEVEPPKKKYPWDSADDRITKGFGLRLMESELMKLKYIAENTPYSIHSFIMMAVRQATDQVIEQLTKEKEPN